MNHVKLSSLVNIGDYNSLSIEEMADKVAFNVPDGITVVKQDVDLQTNLQEAIEVALDEQDTYLDLDENLLYA